jgi:hypothetical protein
MGKAWIVKVPPLPGQPLQFLNVDRHELYPGDEAGTPPYGSAAELRWYRSGDMDRQDFIAAGKFDEIEPPGDAILTMALLAARYEGKLKYSETLHRLGDRSYYQAKIVANVCRWVAEALAPNSGDEPRRLRLNTMIEFFESDALAPSVTLRKNLKLAGKDLSFVCIDHAHLAAALLRALGYHAQEVNILAGIYVAKRQKLEPFYTYQSAALRVWYSGDWHYFDPFLEHTSPSETIVATVTDGLVLRRVGAKAHEVPKIPYAVFVAEGPITSFKFVSSLNAGLRFEGTWRAVEEGCYDINEKSLIVHRRVGLLTPGGR